VRRTIALVLQVGTLTGVGLCALATALYALGSPWAPRAALAGILALFATPPLRLAAAARGFFVEKDPRVGTAALVVLGALLTVAARALGLFTL
jgi:hypothetical protein